MHVGPGMMNAVTGVATAALDSVPLVAISGDIPSYCYGRHPHQEVNLHADADQTAIYRPFVKRAWQVHRVEDLPGSPSGRSGPPPRAGPARCCSTCRWTCFSRPLPDTARAYPLPQQVTTPGSVRRGRATGSPRRSPPPSGR